MASITALQPPLNEPTNPWSSPFGGSQAAASVVAQITPTGPPPLAQSVLTAAQQPVTDASSLFKNPLFYAGVGLLVIFIIR